MYSKLPVNLPLLYQGVWGRADATSDTTNLSNAFQIENSATIGCAVSICKTSHGKIMNESCHTHETQSKSTFLNQCPPTRQVRSYRLQCVFSNTLCSMHTTTRTLQHAHCNTHTHTNTATYESQLEVLSYPCLCKAILQRKRVYTHKCTHTRVHPLQHPMQHTHCNL